MKKLTLQWRITLLTAMILIISSVALTAISMVNAEKSFMALIEESAYTHPTDAMPVEPDLEGTVLVGEASTPGQLAKQGFDLRSISFCVLITVFGTVAAYYVAGQALRPLRNLSGAAKAVNENTLSQRLPDAPAKDEIGALTDSFNEMLARLDDAFLR